MTIPSRKLSLDFGWEYGQGMKSTKMKPPPNEVHPKPPSLLVFFLGWIWDPLIRRWGVFSVPLMVLLVVAGFWGYPRLREEQFMRMGRSAMEAKNYAMAAKAARTVLRSDPDRVEAVRLMVELSRLVPAAPERRQWCERLLALEPGNRAVLIETVGLCLAQKDPARAKELMDQHASRYPGDAGILLWRGILCLLNKDPGAARTFLEQAAALDPANPEIQLNLNKLRLISADPAEVRGAMEALERWPRDQAFHAEARTTLFYYFRDRGDPAGALRLGRQILADSTFPLDQRIAVFRGMGGMKSLSREVLHAESDALRRDCSDSPQKAALLMGSMLEGQAWEDVLSFRESLAPPVRMNPLVSVPAVTALLKLGRMDAVRELAGQPAWEGGEEIRRLIQLRAEELAGRRPSYASLAEDAAADPKRLVKLAALCQQWSWGGAEEVFLLKMARVFPDSTQPLKELGRLYRERKDALGMLRVARKIHQKNPADFGTANNVAALSLLLGLDLRAATSLAGENYQRQPGNPAFVSTYAFALERSGKAAEGLALIEKLPPQVLSRPDISLYHAVLLRACGQEEKARKLAGKLDKSRFLPEEAGLLP